MRTRPRNRHMLRTWTVRNVPKKLGASSRRYWLPGSVPAHSKNPLKGGGHISDPSGLRSDAGRASLLHPDLRSANAAVGTVLVVAVRARLGQFVAEIVHRVDVL